MSFVREPLFQTGKEPGSRGDAITMRHAPVPDAALIERASLAWTAVLESCRRERRAEVVPIHTDDISAPGVVSLGHGWIARDRRWKSFSLNGYGYRDNEVKS